MPYVTYANGKVSGVYARPQVGRAEEKLSDTHPDVLGFRNPEQHDLAASKDHFKTLVDEDAESIRALFITRGQGQMMVYQEKHKEAIEIEGDPSPDATNYPLLAAEISIRGANVSEVGAAVRARAALWTGIAAQIETIRQTAKKNMDAATTPATVKAVYDAVDWSAIPTP